MKKQTCPKCGNKFLVGWDGVYVDGVDICDDCAGVKRDAQGDPWFPGETEHVLKNIHTGKIRIVQRAEVLR